MTYCDSRENKTRGSLKGWVCLVWLKRTCQPHAYQSIERNKKKYLVIYHRLRAKKGPAPPPLGNFADISYLEENFKPHLLRDVCTLCSGALVSDSLLHMLL